MSDFVERSRQNVYWNYTYEGPSYAADAAAVGEEVDADASVVGEEVDISPSQCKINNSITII